MKFKDVLSDDCHILRTEFLTFLYINTTSAKGYPLRVLRYKEWYLCASVLVTVYSVTSAVDEQRKA